jgi:hypothetical protein
MIRLLILCAVTMMLTACHRADAPMPDVFPETSGAWHRTSVRELKPDEAPDPVPKGSIERIRQATYEGPGKLSACVYQMSSSAVALDVVQRWQSAPDTLFFYTDRFFVVVRWDTAERKLLHDFVSAMEKALSAKPSL